MTGAADSAVAPKPITVAVLSPTLWHAGGMVRWSRELIRGLELVAPPERLDIHVIVRHSSHLAQQAVEEYGLRCTIHEVPVLRETTRARIDAVRRMAATLRSISPDVVEVPAGSLWLLGVRGPGCPVIVTAHGFPSKDLIPTHDRLLARQLANRGKAVLVANTERLRKPLDQTIGVKAGTSITLPAGTDDEPTEETQEFRELLRDSFGFADDEQVVVGLGRLVHDKRYDLLIDVADRLRSQAEAASKRPPRFIVVGDGPELATLQAEVTRRGLDETVRFVGHITAPGGYLLGADAFLHPSDTEGAPFSVMEALLAGTPVVATAVGGVPDLVNTPLEGRVVAPGDVDGLVEALAAELEAPGGVSDSMARRDARAARARSRFSLETMGRAHLELIERLAGRG